MCPKDAYILQKNKDYLWLMVRYRPGNTK